MIRTSLVAVFITVFVFASGAQTPRFESTLLGEYDAQPKSPWYRFETDNRFSIDWEWGFWKARLGVVLSGAHQDPSTVNDLVADLGESYFEWNPNWKGIFDYDARVRFGRFFASDPDRKLYDTTIDGVSMKILANAWNARIDWGYHGLHLRANDRLVLTQSDKTRFVDSTTVFASPKAIAAAWFESQVFDSTKLYAGLAIVRDFRSLVDSDSVVFPNSTIFSPSKSGDYDNVYASLGIRSFGDFFFDATWIYQRGETVTFNRDASVLRYITIAIDAVSIEGQMGPRLFQRSLGFDLVGKYTSGDSRPRDVYSEASQTYDRKTSLYKAPQRQEVSFAFPISNGNVSSVGLEANWVSAPVLPGVDLRASNRFQTLFRTELGPIEGFPDVNTSDSRLIGWTNDASVVWAASTWVKFEVRHGLFVPNPHRSVFWLNVKNQWEHRFQFKTSFSF